MYSYQDSLPDSHDSADTLKRFIFLPVRVKEVIVQGTKNALHGHSPAILD